MTAELVRGQNHPLPGTRLEIRVAAGTPVVAAITLGDEQGRAAVTGPDAAASPAGDGWLAHPGAPRLPGVEVPRQAAADHRLAVDLGAMPERVHRVHVLLALPPGRPGPAVFGAAPVPRLAVTTPDGAEAAGYAIGGLGAETALLALELYRRQGGWRVRAVGQGYEGGLPALLADQRAPEPDATAALIHRATEHEQSRAVAPPRPARSALPGAHPPPTPAPDHPGPPRPAPAPPPSAGASAGIDYRHPRRRTSAPPSAPPAAGPAGPAATPAAPTPPGPIPGPTAAPGGPTGPGASGGAGAPPAPVAGDAAGWSMDERLYNQVWGMFEDLTRSVAAYRSAVDFAESRYEQDLDRLLADPRTRGGPQAEAAREEAQFRQMALVDQARAVLDRDLAQLTAEAEVVEPALPPSLAGWDNPCWHAYQAPQEPPYAVRIGSLTLPEAPELRIPLLSRLPMERGLWMDGSEDPRAATDAAVALAARLLASHPAGGYALHVLDPAGSGAASFAPLYAGGALPLPPPAPGAAGVGEVLDRLVERVDLLQMALRGGAADALPPGFDTARLLLIVNEYPYGFDERAVHQLRYLADEGPAAGVHLLLVAERDESAADGSGFDAYQAAAAADPRRSMLRLTPLPSDHLADPWVGHAWTYEPAQLPAGSQVLAQVLRRLAAARPAGQGRPQ
ncbi:TerD family protein [Actinacidiphila sp. DG2A-62]|uniref:TerD family protein n=1 Tax=Actinacidiphila sp. DG2A-62 TaxID=3108821 RepID=UPI002DB7F556|nr:TerD family protein [Actinacidiphila sp. DG2A-62]MEC3993450.1 TerD family protein [Actinacidiphila sp. DG2A-62]